MPRYFFSLSDGTNILVDFEGREFSNAAAAYEHAAEAVAHFLAEGERSLSPERHWDIEITDEDGRLVVSLPFRPLSGIRPPRN